VDFLSGTCNIEQVELDSPFVGHGVSDFVLRLHRFMCVDCRISDLSRFRCFWVVESI